jgi:hypothetical protein
MIAAFVFAAFFYGVAEYEHMIGWKWAVASLIVTFGVLQLTGFLMAVIPAQVVLFGVLWWQNEAPPGARPARPGRSRPQAERLASAVRRRAAPRVFSAFPAPDGFFPGTPSRPGGRGVSRHD